VTPGAAILETNVHGKAQPLGGYEVLLCVTGGIASYKSAELASRLIQDGSAVTVAMTDAARRFVCPLTFQSISRRRVYTSLWRAGEDYSCRHISLTELADLMIIAPATANIIGKMAAGIADDLVSTLVLSAAGACPILIGPAMNTRMWNAQAVRANVEKLTAWGITVVGPDEGYLACGAVGPGRMAEPAEIFQTATELLLRNPPKRQP